MRRREFIALAGAVSAFPRDAFGQQTGKLPRIVFFWPPGIQGVEAYEQGLADFGYIDGKTVTIETFAAQAVADYPALAAKIVASRPDVVINHGGTGALVLNSLGANIPIVVAAAEPVAQGLAASLARPGGNVTGVSLSPPELAGKRLQIAKEIIPTIKRIVALDEPNTPANALYLEQIRIAAKALAIELIVVELVQGVDFATQFERVVASAPQAVYVPASAYFTVNRDVLADLQIKHKLPLIWSTIANPRAMIGYGVKTEVMMRKTGAYVDAVLKGAKPADLPIEQPTIFDLAINLATARALGITIPPSVFAQATKVIE